MWFLLRMAFWLIVVSILLGKSPMGWIVGVEGTASGPTERDRRVPPSQNTLTPADLVATWRDPVRAGELFRGMKQRARPAQSTPRVR